MRIVFDAYELLPGQGKSIGIYNYAKNCLLALAEIIPDDIEIIVLCNALNIADFAISHQAIKPFVIANNAGKFQRLFWLYGNAAWLIKNLKADIYFSPKGFLPKGIGLLSPKTKTVVVVHDLIPLWYQQYYPNYFGRAEEIFINNALLATVKYADLIITISDFTAQDIARRAGRINNIVTVYNGVVISQPGPRPYQADYIFAMASSLPHKNAESILDAYQIYRTTTEAPLPLIICGIADPNQAGVIAVRGLDEASLHAYFAYAKLFVFLSLTEGFGFPPIEALAHGTPVLCSDIPVLKEIGKDLVEYVPAKQVDAIAAKIKWLLTQEDSQAIKDQRMAVLDNYTWQACATGILSALNGLNA